MHGFPHLPCYNSSRSQHNLSPGKLKWPLNCSPHFSLQTLLYTPARTILIKANGSLFQPSTISNLTQNKIQHLYHRLPLCEKATFNLIFISFPQKLILFVISNFSPPIFIFKHTCLHLHQACETSFIKVNSEHFPTK